MEELSSVFMEAGVLMAVGMAFVFGFLSLLIIAINLLASFSSRYPDPVPSVKQPQQTASSNTGEISPNIIAAISSAVAHYRQKNSKA